MTEHPHPESKGGTFSVSRGIWKSDHFDDEPKTQREAFMWMISKARWKDGYQRVDGKMIFMKRGQLAETIRKMADEWLWSKSRVLRFIQRLKIEAVIGTNTGTKTKVITLCKYNEYQLEPSERGTTSGTTFGTKLGQSWDKVARNPLTQNGNSAPNKGNKVNNKDSSVRGMESLTAREDTHTQSDHEFEIDDPGSEDVRSAGDHQTEPCKAQPPIAQGPDPGPGRRRTRDDRSDVAEDEKPFRLPRDFQIKPAQLRYATGLGASPEQAQRSAECWSEHYTVGPGKNREYTTPGWRRSWYRWADKDAHDHGWKTRNQRRPGTLSSVETGIDACDAVVGILRTRGKLAPDPRMVAHETLPGGERDQGRSFQGVDDANRELPTGPGFEASSVDTGNVVVFSQLERVCG